MLKLHSSVLSFIAVFFLCFPTSIHSRTCEVRKGRNICDDGEEIWTVGYGNRSLEAVVECRNGGAHSLADNFIWCRGYLNCTFYAFVGVSNNQNVSARWTVMNNTHLVSELKFYDVVGYSEQNFFLTLREISSTNAMYIWNISIKYCPKENRNGVAISSSGGNSTYGSKEYFSCRKGYYLVDIADNQLATNKATVCGPCARWDRMEKMDCWRAPKVAVNRSLLNIFTAGDQLTSDICTVLDYGKPNASVGLFHDNLRLSMLFTLEPQHNNITVYCTAQNQLTQLLEDVGKFMESFTVEVEFGPTEYTDWTSCTTTKATFGVYNVTLHVSLSSNPPADKPNTFVDGQKQIVFFKSSNGSVGCCGVFVQNFAITLTNVTKKSKVTVEFNQKIQKLKLIYNSITCNCSEDEKTTTANSIETGGISETTIPIICSAVVIVLILIAGFIALCLKKRIIGEDRTLRQSSPPPQSTMIPMTVNPASGASRQPESNEAEGSYEIPIKHEFSIVRDENYERSYQNVPSVSNSGLNEDAAYLF